MTENVLTLLSPRARRVVYIIYGSLGLAGVFLSAFYLASPYSTPWWLVAGMSGLGALVPAFSAIAASNVKPGNPPQPAEFQRDLGLPEGVRSPATRRAEEGREP